MFAFMTNSMNSVMMFRSTFRLILAGGVAAVFVAGMPARAAEPSHCFTGEEQRRAIAKGDAVPLAVVIRALHRAPRDVVRARLCQEPERLVYMLTLLGRDGKVKRTMVDAATGAVVSER
jgi:hypothetical protein